MRLIIFTFFLTLLFPSFPAKAGQEKNLFSECDVQGSTTLYSIKKDEWYRTDKVDSNARTLPASTFKIFHSLIALEQGVTTVDEIFKWDGIKRQFPAWNHNTKLEDAFKNSTIWVYEKLSQRIPTSTYTQYLKLADYEGNGDIHHGEKGNFWVYGDWGISPEEQIKMLIKLYKNELPFSTPSTQTVKNFMKDGNTFGKSGWTNDEKHQIGWWIGYIEREDDTVFFSTRIRKDKNKQLGNFLECRKSITNTLLEKF